MESLLLMVAMIAVFYFLIIRPENKRKKQAHAHATCPIRASSSLPLTVR